MAVAKIAEDRGTNEFDCDVEEDDEGVPEVLDLVIALDVVLGLEEIGLEGVDGDEDEGEGEVVEHAADEVSGGDVRVE